MSVGVAILDSYYAGSYNLPEDFTHRLSFVSSHNIGENPLMKYVTIYSDRNEQGKSANIAEVRDMYYDWNTQISSFVVPADTTLELFQEVEHLGKSIGPYTAGSYNVPSSFKGPINSVILLPVEGTPNTTCPRFCNDSNMGYFSNYSDVCSSSSLNKFYFSQDNTYLRIPKGFKVQLYSEANYKGRSFGPYTQGNYKLPADINFAVGSVRVTPLCPTFYKDINDRVNNLQLCSSGRVPTEWKDQITAFYVPHGYIIYLYKGSKYSGGKIGPYNVGYHNVTDGFKNKVGSVLIFEQV